MDFVLNRDLADLVREAIEKTLALQCEDMEKSAEELLESARQVDESIRQMQADLAQTTSQQGRADIQERIDAATTRAAALRTRASALNREAFELDRARRETSRLHAEIVRMAQYTDGRYAAQIAALQTDISRYMNVMVGLKNSMGIISADGTVYSSIGQLVLNPKFADKWDWVNETLRQSAEDITPKQYATLAWWFALQTEVEGQERFLNAFLEPLHLTARSDTATHFTICPQKVGNVQIFLEGGIIALFIDQMNHCTTSDAYRHAQTERDFLKGLSALLTVINSLTDHSNNVNSFPLNASQAAKRVIIAVGDGSVISLSANSSGGHTISVGLGTLHPSETGASFVIPNEASGWRNQHAERSTINISPILCGVELNDRKLTSATGFFHLRHQFDLATHLVGQSVDLIVSLATLGASSAASVIINLSTIGINIAPAAKDAGGVQDDFMTLYGQLRYGLYQRDFELRGVIIEHQGQPPRFQSWATAHTHGALDVFNNVAGTNFTWEDYMKNPAEIYRIYSEVLDSSQRTRIYRELREYQSERENEFSQQATREEHVQPPPQASRPQADPPRNQQKGPLDHGDMIISEV